MTVFHVLPKWEGKTARLIRWADMNAHGNQGRYIVALNHKRAHGIALAATELGCDIHFPLTLATRRQGLGPGVRELALDDLDDMLPQLLQTNLPIVHVTATT